ncbi:MAG: replication initiator protein A [Defluviitaleaceae bacterium]|nr:replication initiator protein A [Defluviitaleaceae bacterium]MCL2273418.1 replication initiator protein A [Defluviitaleaceae bacterium]
MDNRQRYTRQNIVTSAFYQLPKFLFDAELANLSNDARVLYALLRNRHEIKHQKRLVR